jgi:tRNA(fMet)-specific endonuclease VapC
MKRIAIDTSYYSAFKRGRAPHLLIPLKSAEYIGISTVVLGELLGGFKTGSQPEKYIEELEKFLATPRVFVNGIDEDTADFYSEIYKRLRKKGKPIPSNDMWIAACAMQNGQAVLTLDNHFELIDGLNLIKLPGGK